MNKILHLLGQYISFTYAIFITTMKVFIDTMNIFIGDYLLKCSFLTGNDKHRSGIPVTNEFNVVEICLQINNTHQCV